ncbi:MAG: 50S ribosomal protein L18 [Candidatus Yanofskybacteria bacterium GW2011_GWA2_41_22]|uniref:Large ribosomal subunit protein uL18 n=5 Tax=Parcubacteria group TaxID=1794811 RepID=A0A1F8HU11_9BACT|nr:MAG: 50S ribosomal protein L18 [Candidatus Yanofskybacteria bacterium GW2011_GWA2_41_22]KKS25732.1 MAG: 50S ribosomal protein L18 [Candidatus Jorgensenbacteria bacterium GW2011_GWF2_41_8]KKS27575.1 MAG: 50S ribosomal protein L18 [Candidatus Yanofskybacteria bacterium GW2011_GWC2_41_9]OGM99872.1 MAG: 50S ribosomal protein L18 [Candidatus Yanofskybacteria bacterium RIFCSPHIGHO2_01_FULL_41_27]OGN08843.1 MAG: 50S ribosomal protein L18 [Candidatus Yanofskybacteria bacterium RIFCSPHIGHO2_02_FULL_4
MNKTSTKKQLRLKRHKKVRAIITGTAVRPRVSVFKSNKHIFAQIIDDENQKTIVSASDMISKTKTKEKTKAKKSERAFKVGESLAIQMQEKNIKEAVFDRGGFKYHGRVKSLADGLRKGGIKI